MVKQISFYKKLVPLILSGKKTGTIRDKSESHYEPGQILDAITNEENKRFCQIEVLNIEKVAIDELNRSHAKAEGFLFVFPLKRVVRKIYSKESELYFIGFKVID